MLNKKTFTVELGTDSPNNIDAEVVHLALMNYFVAFVSIDVKEEAAQQGVQADERYCVCKVPNFNPVSERCESCRKLARH